MGLLERYWLDDSEMPIRLGSALRVPSYAYHSWGIKGPEKSLRRESERGYEVEWLGLDGKGGSPQQMKYVAEAITSTGLGNYSQMLRDKGAEIVSFFVREIFKGRQVRYLETGAGVSTEAVIKKLKDEGVDLDRIFFTLVEPGKGRIESTAAKLESQYGLKREKNFRIIIGRDLDIPQFVEESSQDIALAVATHHHHAFLDEPTEAIAYSLSPGGVLRYVDEFKAAGLNTDPIRELTEAKIIENNPHKVLPTDSRILMVTIGEKKVESSRNL